MTDHKWKQEALKNFPFELTPDQKKQMTETSPWASFSEVEKICSGFLYWRSKFDARDTRKETLQYLNGHGDDPGLIAKLQKCSDANKELWKALYNVPEWLPGGQADRIRDGMKQTIPHIDMMLKQMKTLDYLTNKSQNGIPEYYLCDALADLYHEVTGHEDGRNNDPREKIFIENSSDKKNFNRSHLADIIKILRPVLGCTSCTGHITTVIRTRKEIKENDQAL